MTLTRHAISLGIVRKHKLSTSDDTSVSTKSSKFTTMEKCLIVIAAIQSVMLVVTN